MKPPIFIVIKDNNQFFIYAMQIILSQYFYSKNVPVIFMLSEHTRSADLVVTTEYASKRCGLEWQRNMILRQKISGMVCQQEELSLKEKPEAVNYLLDTLFSSRRVNPLLPLPPLPKYQNISPREWEVLQAIAEELSLTQIAERLNISIKTVSGHKHTAMRKLGFDRSHHLYCWLLQGGLAEGKEIRIPSQKSSTGNSNGY